MFSHLFQWTKKNFNTKVSSQYSFGRYSDNNKTKHQLNEWDNATKAFEDKRYNEGFKYFFHYLKDSEINNVTVKQVNDNWEFELQQGSKLITGITDNTMIYVQGKIANMPQPSVAIMRRLLNANFTLNYSRFCLDKNDIILKTESRINNINPTKLYFMLKEVATKCDRLDDQLKSDFDTLQHVARSAITPYPIQILKAKYDWLQNNIDTLLERIAKLDHEKDHGAISYLLMTFIFRIDYFISPEGKIKNIIEQAANSYFAQDNISYPDKNKQVCEEIQSIKKISLQEFENDVYQSVSTFSSVNPVNYQNIVDSIENSNKNYDWFHKNEMEDVAICCAEYGLLYCKFYYSLPQVVTEIIDILLNVLHTPLYQAMGIDRGIYNETTHLIDSALLHKHLEKVVSQQKEKYPKLSINTSNIKTDTKLNLALSICHEITCFNFSNS